jgi:hypothetical protein
MINDGFFFTFCAFFPLFISSTSIVSINFGANLDAQNAGNDISGIQISNIFWGSTPREDRPPFMRDILATHVAFSHCYPPLIYYLTERSLFKKCPPTGKSLKKALYFIYDKSKILARNSFCINIDRGYSLFKGLYSIYWYFFPSVTFKAL